MTALGVALPGVPAVAALVGLLVPYRRRALAASLGIGAAAIALVCAVAANYRHNPLPDAGVVLVHFGPIPVTFGTWVNQPAALVAVAVAVVALCVQVYSVAYLHDDERYAPYAAQVSLFTAAMLLVVVAGDLIVLLVGWEVMGICSYLLIGHDRRLPEAPAAAVKAFLVTRVGDVGFLLGIVLLGINAQSFRIADVIYRPLPAHVVLPACVLLLAGVAGKSAQFPLHTWLPDAMAGPTPISALIHAATMVAAGVYVVARLYPLFQRTPVALTVLAVVASITMLLGGLAATAQDDIKRVLAWSTVSQLGYMTGSLAVDGRAQALFHLLTHAAFKALLFLSAGAVIHAVGSNLMPAMGGLRRRMPVTFWCMTIGLGALAGVPPLAGFWSKDSIFEAASRALGDHGGVPFGAALAVYLSAAVTALLTGFYAMRLWRLTFFGDPRGDSVHAHEPPWAMRGPMVLLAVPAALLGFAGLVGGFGRRLLAGEAVAHLTLSGLVPLALAAAGVALAWRRDASVDPIAAVPRRAVLANAFYLDAVQDALVTRPVLRLAALVRRTDESLVDGAVEATGVGALGAGGLLVRLHRAALPRAMTFVLAGAVVVGVIAAAAFGVTR
jgi:NADH-quinone oxidoreductase subunit L